MLWDTLLFAAVTFGGFAACVVTAAAAYETFMWVRDWRVWNRPAWTDPDGRSKPW